MSIVEHVTKVRHDRRRDFGLDSLDFLPGRTRRGLNRVGDRFTVWPGEVLLDEGSTARWMFVVLEGELVLRREGRDQKVFRTGSTYGALEGAFYRRATGQLVARDVTRVLALPVRAYRALAETDPHFGYWVIRALAKDEAT